jgi:hypothetical protein
MAAKKWIYTCQKKIDMLKLSATTLLLLLIAYGCTQSPNTVYHFNLASDNTPFSKAEADSCITILKDRLKNAGYKNSLVSYDPSQRQFTVKVVAKGKDDFIKNALANQCEVYFTEMYPLDEFIQLLAGQQAIQDSILKYMAFSNYQTDYKVANIGMVMIKDTASFTALIHSLKDNFPADCFFTYEMTADPTLKGMIEVYAYKKNDHAIYVNKCLHTAKQDIDATGHPVVRFKFTPFGTHRFASITRLNIGKPIGILINGKMCSAPIVNGEITGGNAELAGVFTVSEAQEIAANLNSGNLPVKLILEK